MNSVLLAISLFLPSLMGLEVEVEDVPDLCSEEVDEESVFEGHKTDVLNLISIPNTIQCDTMLISDEIRTSNKVVHVTTEGKEELKEELSSIEAEKEELESIIKEHEAEIKAQEAEIKESNENLKRIQEEHKVKLGKERKAKEDALALKEIKKEEEAQKTQVATETTQTTPKTSNKATSGGQTYEVTYYSAYCPTCGQWGGITATGLDISDTITHNGHGIVAVDPNRIPLGSIVEIDGKTYSAQDTGGAIKGNRIDILVNSTEEAYSKGRHNVQLKVLSEG